MVALIGSPNLSEEPESLGCIFEVLGEVPPLMLAFSKISSLPSLIVTLKALLIDPGEKPAEQGPGYNLVQGPTDLELDYEFEVELTVGSTQSFGLEHAAELERLQQCQVFLFL